MTSLFEFLKVFYSPEGVFESYSQEIHLVPLSILLVSKRVLGVLKAQSVSGPFEILKMLYPLEGVCENSSNRVHLTPLSI